MKKWVLAAVAPGGSVGWLLTGDCTNSGDVGSILDVSGLAIKLEVEKCIA